MNAMETHAGLYYNGKRNFFGGRAVLLIGGNITNVPAADWTKFLQQQEQLRNATLAKRTEQINDSNRTNH